MAQTTLSGHTFNLILRKNVSHTAKLLWVLLVLDDVVTTREGIARVLGVSVRQAERAAAELLEVGALEVQDGWRVGVHSVRRVWTPVALADDAASTTATKTSQQVDLFPAGPTHQKFVIDKGDNVVRDVDLAGSESSKAFRSKCPTCAEVPGNYCGVNDEGEEWFHAARLSSTPLPSLLTMVPHVDAAANEPTAEDRRAAKRYGRVKARGA